MRAFGGATFMVHSDGAGRLLYIRHAKRVRCNYLKPAVIGRGSFGRQFDFYRRALRCALAFSSRRIYRRYTRPQNLLQYDAVAHTAAPRY